MKRAVVFVVLAMVVIGSCAAQSANDSQRIVGTWVSEDGKVTIVFNTNGTGTGEGGGEKHNFSYGISASGEIYISIWGTNKLFMSPDGRRMYLSNFNIFFLKK